jgi:hypothetical protein
VVATHSDAAESASVQVEVVDAFGNQHDCASTLPAAAEPPKPTPSPEQPETIRKELSARGRHHVEVIHRLSNTMRYLTVRNSRRGLHSVEVWVNHRRYHVGPLKDGQVKSLDIARALKSGKRNTIVLIGRGRHHETAVVTIANRK